jgi:hypothetical protein
MKPVRVGPVRIADRGDDPAQIRALDGAGRVAVLRRARPTCALIGIATDRSLAHS